LDLEVAVLIEVFGVNEVLQRAGEGLVEDFVCCWEIGRGGPVGACRGTEAGFDDASGFDDGFIFWL
jgi:hypothetical protein